MRIKVLLIVFALALPATGVFAQPQEAPGRDRARMFLVLRIADALKLNEQEALKVSEVVRRSDDHRRELAQQRQEIEDKLREALAKQPPESAQLTALINQCNDVDQKLALVPEESFRDLQKVLSTEQQARLMLFRRELQGEIRRAVQGRRAGNGRRGRGQGGPPSE